ncbi:hypothetical protein ACJMK2_000580 [Sinanodonta woodiana]|uniref:Cadherin domain-containing protein n=1 Tax=Sinanodonta woodiana TaxID=1069815 RepID=A0ABD3XPP1_SINWO
MRLSLSFSTLFLILYTGDATDLFSDTCTSATTVGNINYYTSIDNNKGFGYMIEHNAYVFPCCGVVTLWESQVGNPGTLQMQVWRRYSVSNWTLVGENQAIASGAASSLTAVSYSVPVTERITVRKGDYIGWYTSNDDMVKYTADTWTGTSYPTMIHRIMMSDLYPGDNYDWTNINVYYDRYYAIRATVSPGSAPYFVNLGSSVTIDPSTAINSILFTVSVTDSDPDDISKLEVTMVKSYINLYSFDTSTLKLSTISSLSDREGETHTVVFMVKETNCYQYNTATLTIVISPRTLTFTNLPAVVSLAEGTTSQSLLYTIGLNGSAWYYCYDTSSNLKFQVRPNSVGTTRSQTYGVYVNEWPQFSYATAQSYTVNVRCVDTESSRSASSTLTVNINKSSAPVFTNLDNTTTVDAHSAYIGNTIFRVLATDADNDMLTFSMTCSPSGCPFQLMYSGHLQLNDWILSWTTASYKLSITVTDTHNNVVGPKYLTVNIINIDDIPQILNVPLTPNLEVRENTPLGTTLMTVSVYDADSADTLTYTYNCFQGEAFSYFSLNPYTGVLKTAYKLINYETISTSTLSLTITVGDHKKYDREILTVVIKNENEAPYFSYSEYNVYEQEGLASNYMFLNVSNLVSDVDASETLVFGLDCGVYTDYFSMASSSGLLSFKGVYDLDTIGTPSDVRCNATVEDIGGLSAKMRLNIYVALVNDHLPSFQLSSYTFYVAAATAVGTLAFSLTATDHDTNTGDVITYSLNQSMLADSYFMITNDGSVYVLKTLAPLYIGAELSFIARATDSASHVGTSTVLVKVPVSTTTVTTTTDRTMMFTESYTNIIWLVPTVMAFVCLIFLTAYMFYLCFKHSKRCSCKENCCCVPGWNARRLFIPQLNKNRPNPIQKQNKQPPRGHPTTFERIDYEDDISIVDREESTPSVSYIPPASRIVTTPVGKESKATGSRSGKKECIPPAYDSVSQAHNQYPIMNHRDPPNNIPDDDGGITSIQIRQPRRSWMVDSF